VTAITARATNRATESHPCATALEAAGVIFVAENGDGPGVREITPQESIPSEDLNASNDE
jgi:hypothetical protein